MDALGYCYKTLEVNATTKNGRVIPYELRFFSTLRLWVAIGSCAAKCANKM